MEIHEKLKSTREDADISQSKLAMALDTTQNQISRWEIGKNDMTAKKLKAFCEYFQVSADYILGLPEGLSWPR